MALRSSVINKTFDLFGLLAFKNDISNRYKYLINFDIKSRNAHFMRTGAPDGLPIPPPQLVYLVSGQYDIESFYHNGVQGVECIKAILAKNGLDINEFESILDFGCGCGRIIRHWKKLNGPKIHGSDYNPRLVNWCRSSLPFAEFNVNNLSSNLDYEDDNFDFVYAISIFTHLDEDLQFFWLRELTRILKPGGYLLITVHGTTHVSRLTPEERERYEDGELVLVRERYAGTNTCGAYHPEKYVREEFCKELTVVDFVPGGAKDADQDAFLLRKPIKA